MWFRSTWECSHIGACTVKVKWNVFALETQKNTWFAAIIFCQLFFSNTSHHANLSTCTHSFISVLEGISSCNLIITQNSPIIRVFQVPALIQNRGLRPFELIEKWLKTETQKRTVQRQGPFNELLSTSFGNCLLPKELLTRRSVSVSQVRYFIVRDYFAFGTFLVTWTVWTLQADNEKLRWCL